MRTLKELWHLVAATIGEFIEDDCMSMAGALAFYTMFSLPPLLLIVVTVTSYLFPFSQKQISAEIVHQINSMIGQQTGEQIVAMLKQSRAVGPTTAATVLGIGILVFAATSVLAQLQYSLNVAWEVEPDPEVGGVRNFLFKRVMSLAMLLAIAFLLLVSLLVSAGLAAFHDLVNQWFASSIAANIALGVNLLLSFALITFLFAAIYKVLPDAQITWKDVFMGSVVSAFLFVAGKYLISFYLGSSNIGSTYGAASALAVVLIWVYYASLIVFFGAEFTQVWARRHGSGIRPVRGAVRTIRHREHVRGRQASGAEPGKPEGTQPDRD